MPTVTKPVLPKRSTVAGKVPLPTDLAVAEIAVNFADRKIYGKNPADNTVVPLGGAGQAYYNQETAPTGEINLGDEWYKPSTGTLYKYVSDGTTSLWIDTSAANAVATLTKFVFIATAGQTVFSGNDANSVPLTFTAGSEIVTLNGIELLSGVDYNASTNTITLTTGATAGHELVVKAFGAFDVANAYTQAQTDGKIASSIFGFKNYIINGGFNINQYPAYTATDGVKVDRWVISGAANIGNAIIGNLNGEAESNSGLNFVKNGTGDSVLSQRIEFPRRLSGKTITVSFATYSNVSMNADIYFDGYNSVNGSVVDIGNLVQSFTWGTGWVKRSFTFTLPTLNENYNSASSYLMLNIRIKSGSTTTGAWLTDVQLERGSVATPFEHRPIGLELSLCQRYYEVTQVNNQFYGIAGLNWQCSVPFKATKRVNPTVVVTTPTGHTNIGTISTSGNSINALIATGAVVANGTVNVQTGFTASAEL